MADQEASIIAAINDLSTGIYTSYHKAAKAYNIPKSTLRNQIKGAINHTISY
jgi:hypothetical protein